VDIYTRESLAIEASQSLSGEDVVPVLNRLILERDVPRALFCDNGAEFTGQTMDMWAYRNGVKIDFSRPGELTDNAFLRVVQWNLPGRMPGYELVPVPGRSQASNRGLTRGI
jgi:transposase InsO family protein